MPARGARQSSFQAELRAELAIDPIVAREDEVVGVEVGVEVRCRWSVEGDAGAVRDDLDVVADLAVLVVRGVVEVGDGEVRRALLGV